MGLPGGWRRRNRAQLCARLSPALPGSAEAHSSDAGGVFAFVGPFSAAWGGLGSSLSIPHLVLWLGGHKGQDTRRWFLTTRCIYPLPWSYSPETSQGVLLNSLGVDAVEIGRIIAPDPSPTSPRSAEAPFGNAGGVFAFLRRICAARRGWGLPWFVPCTALWLGGLKGQETCGWFLTTHVFWQFWCL